MQWSRLQPAMGGTGSAHPRQSPGYPDMGPGEPGVMHVSKAPRSSHRWTMRPKLLTRKFGDAILPDCPDCAVRSPLWRQSGPPVGSRDECGRASPMTRRFPDRCLDHCPSDADLNALGASMLAGLSNGAPNGAPAIRRPLSYDTAFLRPLLLHLHAFLLLKDGH